MNQHEQALELVQRYADGLASADETEQLAGLLRADVAVRDQFLEYLNIDLALEDYAAAGEASPATTGGFGRRIPPRRWRIALAVAAAITLVVTATVWSVRTHLPGSIDNPSTSFVAAEVLAADGVQWVGQGRPFSTGAWLKVDRLQIAQGTLTLRLESGVVLELLGPADCTFEAPMRLRLTKGRLNADVGEQGRGFTVVTAAGEVVDLGTRFAVDVSDGMTIWSATPFSSSKTTPRARSTSTSGGTAPAILCKTIPN